MSCFILSKSRSTRKKYNLDITSLLSLDIASNSLHKQKLSISSLINLLCQSNSFIINLSPELCLINQRVKISNKNFAIK